MIGLIDRIVRYLRWLALILCGWAFVDFILHPLAPDFAYHSILFRVVTILVFTPLTLLVGYLIIRRVPGNLVGSLLILWSGTVVFGSLRQDIGSLAFGIFGWYEIAIGWLSLFYLVLHFPDGKICPTGASSWIYGLTGISIIVSTLIILSNPIASSGSANLFLLPALQKLNGGFTWLNILINSPMFVLALVSPVLRFQRGSSLERQQIKWLALLGAILSMGTVLGFIVIPLIYGSTMFHRAGNNLFTIFFFATMGLFPPLVIGIAVLRYRLWDIDIIIRRTLVYSILTVILTLIYFVIVVLLQELFQLVTGEHQSPIATVLSTLAIATLFIPIRRRIQVFIDRRFYRQKYNADQVLAEFSATLRNEVNLDKLKDSVLSVVQETLRPEYASLWMRKVESRQKEWQFTQEQP